MDKSSKGITLLVGEVGGGGGETTTVSNGAVEGEESNFVIFTVVVVLDASVVAVVEGDSKIKLLISINLYRTNKL